MDSAPDKQMTNELAVQAAAPPSTLQMKAAIQGGIDSTGLNFSSTGVTVLRIKSQSSPGAQQTVLSDCSSSKDEVAHAAIFGHWWGECGLWRESPESYFIEPRVIVGDAQ